jgi:hypothetical protein
MSQDLLPREPDPHPTTTRRSLPSPNLTTGPDMRLSKSAFNVLVSTFFISQVALAAPINLCGSSDPGNCHKLQLTIPKAGAVYHKATRVKQQDKWNAVFGAGIVGAIGLGGAALAHSRKTLQEVRNERELAVQRHAQITGGHPTSASELQVMANGHTTGQGENEMLHCRIASRLTVFQLTLPNLPVAMEVSRTLPMSN